MSNSVTMIGSQEEDKWFDFAKILAPCITVIFLINSYIKSYFKDRALERDAALQVLIKQTIDSEVRPDIRRLTDSIEKLNDAITDLKIRSNK
jgi:hypothetical protein